MDKKPGEDPPLIADEGGTPFGSPVIDLADFRIRFGRRPATAGPKCEHRALIYSRDERRVWCEDCTRTLDSFDAFMIFTAHFHEMEASAQAKLRRAKEAEQSTVHRRSAKVFDQAWGGRHQMAVCCPHCGTGLLPEDFLSGGSQCSAEIERARRARKGQPA